MYVLTHVCFIVCPEWNELNTCHFICVPFVLSLELVYSRFTTVQEK
jgi:hypothetical protein